MKQLTVIKENGWHWPATGDYTWDVVSASLGLHTAIAPYLKQTNVVVQAGGNGGLMVQPFAEKFKDVYTFEPDPLNFYCLTLNVTGANVHKFQACLGNERAMVSLNTMYANDNGAFFIEGKGKVPVLRIDDLGLDECDLIQLDIEGFEYQALLGGLETIKKYKPVIAVEFCKPWAERYGITETILDDLLISQLGYTKVTIFDQDRIYTHTS